MEHTEPYSLLARDYDEELGEIFEAFQRPVFDHVIERYLPRGGTVLDLACGTGRVACYLAGQGFRLTGLDRSPSMLEVARGREGAEGVTWIEADMCDLGQQQKFSLICCNFDSVNQLLEPTAVRALLAEIAGHLDPDGYVVFDVITQYALEKTWADLGRVIERSDYFAVWRSSYDAASRQGILVADYFTLGEDGAYRPWRETHRETAYSDQQLRDWIEVAGMVIRETRADREWGQPTSCTERIAYVCQLAKARKFQGHRMMDRTRDDGSC